MEEPPLSEFLMELVALASPTVLGVAIPSSSAAESTATATTTRTITTAPFFTRTGDVHGERAALEFFAVEHFHCFVCFIGAGEFDECEAAGFPGEFIEHEIHGGDAPGRGEKLLKILFQRLVREVTDE